MRKRGPAARAPAGVKEKNVIEFLNYVNIDMPNQSVAIKNSNKNMNRSWSSRNILSVYPQQEAASKGESKAYSKIVSKYSNGSKQTEKVKNLSKENKRLK